MQLGDATLLGHITQHLITQGIEKLDEGCTICYPDRVYECWVVLGMSSDGKPALVIKDTTRDSDLFTNCWVQAPTSC